jgi:hypothetical protein
MIDTFNYDVIFDFFVCSWKKTFPSCKKYFATTFVCVNYIFLIEM